ncbi:MAG: outer membrane beta-barrel protein, partial [Gemmatimonadetes bacterium]|nr:outer membrane beta-barrel protein [Gemmatimonadota bacterium]
MNSQLRKKTNARIAGAVLGAAVAFLVLPGASSAAGIDGLSYTFAPSIEQMQWDDDVLLKDDVLYGGRMSVNFGKSVALRGFYLYNDKIGIDGEGPDLGNTEYTNFGADVQFSLPADRFVPYLYGGGGIVRFNPDTGEKSDRIGLKYGAGIRFGVTDRAEMMIYAEDNAFRLDEATEVPAEKLSLLAEGNDDGDLQHNISFGAGLNFFLGGYSGDEDTDIDRAYREQFSGGLKGLSVKVQPMVGRLDYDKAIDLADQDFVGTRVGLGFGEYVDFRAFYWRGVNGDWDDFEQIQSYGGEAQFNLNPSPGVSPHLILGAGNLDYMSGYKVDDMEGTRPDDEIILIGGVGADITLNKKWLINIAARDYIFSAIEDPEETSDPDDLFHNWVYTVGTTFILGGDPDEMKTAAVEEEPVWYDADEDDRDLIAKSKTVEPKMEKVTKDTVVVKKIEKSMPVESPVRTYQGDKIVTLPVPTVGEIYIRYGPAGGVSIESKGGDGTAPAPVQPAPTEAPKTGALLGDGQSADDLRTIIRDAIRDEMGDSAAVKKQMKEMEDRLLDKIDERIEEKTDRVEKDLQDVEKDLQSEIDRADRGTKTIILDSKGDVVATTDGAVKEEGIGLGFSNPEYYIGAAVDEPEQFIM